jgi:hypothetical protein
VAGVRVQAQRYVYQSGGERRLIGAGPMPGPPLTDDLGQFRIYGLIPGSYVLRRRPADVGWYHYHRRPRDADLGRRWR